MYSSYVIFHQCNTIFCNTLLTNLLLIDSFFSYFYSETYISNKIITLYPINLQLNYLNHLYYLSSLLMLIKSKRLLFMMSNVLHYSVLCTVYNVCILKINGVLLYYSTTTRSSMCTICLLYYIS